MAMGAGKYDDIATTVMFEAQADLVLIAIVNGNRGEGFAVQCKDAPLMRSIPQILRNMADQLEDDMQNTNWEELANANQTNHS
jgi:hypothetical protein